MGYSVHAIRKVSLIRSVMTAICTSGFFYMQRYYSSLNLTKEYSDITHTPQNPPLIKLIVCIITLIALKIVHFHNVLFFRLRKLMHAV